MRLQAKVDIGNSLAPIVAPIEFCVTLHSLTEPAYVRLSVKADLT